MSGVQVARASFCCALLLASSVLAGCTRSPRAAEPPAADSAAGAEVASDDPVVCEKVEVTGRRYRKRVCRSESEIRAQREASQAGVRGVRPEPPPVPELGSGM